MVALRRLPPRSLAFDLSAAGVLFLLVLVPAVLAGPIEVIILVLLCGALAIRRLSPGLALSVAWLAAILQMVLRRDASPIDLLILGVLYATAAHGERFVRWAGLASAGLGAVVAAAYLAFLQPALAATPAAAWEAGGSATVFAFYAVGLLALLGLSWTLGLLARTARLARAGRLESRISQERARYEVAVEQERTRIARDMHDVVAHSLAVVIAQADGARYVGRSQPEAQGDALATIASTARTALSEVRVLLGELRHPAGQSPQPGLSDLAALVEQFRASGMPLRVEAHGEPIDLGAGHEIAAYRIAQEALTNALRHGTKGAPVVLTLRWEDDALHLRVENRSSDAWTGVGGGHGLAGMRERASLAGGTLDAAAADGSFTVRAVIPGREGNG